MSSREGLRTVVAVTAEAVEPELPSATEFRATLRNWFRANVDASAQASYTDEDRKQTTARAYDAGMLHVTWPVEYGGRGLPPEYQTVFNEETAWCGWALTNSSGERCLMAAILAAAMAGSTSSSSVLSSMLIPATGRAAT